MIVILAQDGGAVLKARGLFHNRLNPVLAFTFPFPSTCGAASFASRLHLCPSFVFGSPPSGQRRSARYSEGPQKRQCAEKVIVSTVSKGTENGSQQNAGRSGADSDGCSSGGVERLRAATDSET